LSWTHAHKQRTFLRGPAKKE